MSSDSTTKRKVIGFEIGPFAGMSMGLPGDHEGQTAVRTFLVRGGGKIGLIDSGLHAGLPDLERGFEELGLRISDLDTLLLTHEHMDHVGNNGALKRESGCLILGSAERADRVADNRLNATTIVHAFPDVAPLFDLDREYLSWMGPDPGPIDRFIADGDHVAVGDVTLEVVAVPGHSAAELGFYDATSRTLVLADPLLPSFNPVLYLYENPSQMRATFDKIERFLVDRDVSTVLLAHDEPKTRAEAIDLINDCRRRVDRVEQSILGNIRREPGIGLGALRDRVCDDNGKVREWRALVSIDASLRAFHDAGLIDRAGDGWVAAMSPGSDGTTKVAVLGAGIMGAQIALAFAAAGHPVRLWGRREEALAAARGRVMADLDVMRHHGLVAPDSADAVEAQIETGTDLAWALSEAAFAIEAVVEDIEAKSALLQAAEAVAGPETVLSSTTSALSPTVLQSALERPERFVVAHFAQPAHLVRLVEVVPGAATGEVSIAACTTLLSNIGKLPVRCPDIPGFLWARIQHAILREFASLVGQGLTTPDVCDLILKEGYSVRLPAMGCFEHADLAGLDLMNSAAARRVWADLSTVTDPERTPVGALWREGKLGMASGHGFYDWSVRDPVAFKRGRDAAIIRRLLA